MAKLVVAPKMGNTVESIILGEIKVKIGDKIKIDEVLFEYETDKSTTEFKSEIEGEVLAILYEEGDEVKVLDPIIVIGKKGEDISNLVAKTSSSSSSEPNPNSTEKEAKPTSEKNEETVKSFEQTNQNISIDNQQNFSPRAKKTMQELNIKDIEIAGGSGVNGRIIESDIVAYHQQEKQTQPKTIFNRVKYSPTRQVIAKAMENSLQHGAQLTLSAPFDATSLLQARAKIKQMLNQNQNIENSSINDLIIYVLSKVLVQFPHINSIIGENYYDAYNVANISIAVDAPKGLLVPVLQNASSLSLGEITRESKNLINKARNGKLTAKEQANGTFTISNLGLSGVTVFTPILNYPQSAILGVGSPITRIKFDNNRLVSYSEITLSLTMDHRPYDGAQGAEFLKVLIKELENIQLK